MRVTNSLRQTPLLRKESYPDPMSTWLSCQNTAQKPQSQQQSSATRVWYLSWQSLSFTAHPSSLQWSWNLVGGQRGGIRAPPETGGLDLSWETQTSPTTGQSHRGNPKGELTCERSRILSRGGGKKLLALCQTKNELFWPLYCSGYPMTIQYFHPGQRHVFWERFTMLA